MLKLRKTQNIIFLSIIFAPANINNKRENYTFIET